MLFFLKEALGKVVRDKPFIDPRIDFDINLRENNLLPQI